MLEYLAQVAKGPMQKLEVCASGTPHLPSSKQSPLDVALRLKTATFRV